MPTRAYGNDKTSPTRPSMVAHSHPASEPCPTCGSVRGSDLIARSPVEPFWPVHRPSGVVQAEEPSMEARQSRESQQRIGEYLVKRLIGEGGMGKVYEAEERLSHRRVALKVLRPELTRNEDGRRLFLNEMQILAHLEHPNLVRSLASMETEG